MDAIDLIMWLSIVISVLPGRIFVLLKCTKGVLLGDSSKPSSRSLSLIFLIAFCSMRLPR